MSENKTDKVTRNNGKFAAGGTRPENAGRKKGTPNKKTKELQEILGAFNPAEKLMEIYNSTEDEQLKASICKDLLKYVYPQRKAVEMTADVDMPIISIKGL